MFKLSAVLNSALLAASAFLLFGCESASVQGYFASIPAASTTSPDNTNGGTNIGGGGGGTSTITLKTIQPAFAVRGLNCMMCHGVVGANVVTDFGYGTANFLPMFTAVPGVGTSDGGRTAYNDLQSGWQNATISGSLHVPKIQFTASQAQNDFGVSSATSLAAILQMPNLGGNQASMASTITPVAGQNAVIEDSVISITYPSQAELVNLLPANLQNQAAAIAIIPLAGVPNAAQTGLGLSPSGKYIENTQSTVTCYGDVAIKGPLFLNNVNLVSDSNGCRLYVAGSVFIQGPINHVNGVASNLQITSSRAVIMGFSTVQMGANTSGSSQIRVSNVTQNAIKTAGGPYARFATPLDSEYNPGQGNINGVAPSAFFDSIVSDALLIGSLLNDAGEPAAFNNLVTGESIVTETNVNNDQGSYQGQRVAINYSGLLLNAPEIHSRYGGTFSGVMIADVAMLARNPQSVNTIEQYSYDQRFSTVPAILPALTTTILDIQH